MKVQMSSGVTERQRCSQSATRRARSRPAISSSIEIASSLEPVIRTTCSSFGSLVADLADLRHLLVVLDDDHLGVGVLEHVAALLGGVGLVDRDDGRPGGQRGEVEVGPLGPGVGEDRDLVALLDRRGRSGRARASRTVSQHLGEGAGRPVAVLVLEHDRRLGRGAAAASGSRSAIVLRPVPRSASAGRGGGYRLLHLSPRCSTQVARGHSRLRGGVYLLPGAACRRRPRRSRAGSCRASAMLRSEETKRVLSIRPWKIGTPSPCTCRSPPCRFMCSSSASSVGVR